MTFNRPCHRGQRWGAWLPVGLEKSPVFRRAIIPWYDRTPLCLILMAAMAGVFLFALAGIGVSLEAEPSRGVLWVPVVLLLLSATVMVSLFFRLLRRYLRRLPE